MHHLGIGAAHARKRVLALADDRHVTVIEFDTGEVLSTHVIAVQGHAVAHDVVAAGPAHDGVRE